MENTFGGWSEEFHKRDDQQKKIKSALERKLTPLNINRNEQTGVFKGSKGETYNVTLKHCDCVNFRGNHAPCKHMYRLAMELGEFPGIENAKSGEVILPDDVLEKIAVLSEAEQLSFSTFCYRCGNDNKNAPCDIEKNLALKLEELGLINVERYKIKFALASLSDQVAPIARKVNARICKKFPRERDPFYM